MHFIYICVCVCVCVRGYTAMQSIATGIVLSIERLLLYKNDIFLLNNTILQMLSKLCEQQ